MRGSRDDALGVLAQASARGQAGKTAFPGRFALAVVVGRAHRADGTVRSGVGTTRLLRIRRRIAGRSTTRRRRAGRAASRRRGGGGPARRRARAAVGPEIFSRSVAHPTRPPTTTNGNTTIDQRAVRATKLGIIGSSRTRVGTSHARTRRATREGEERRQKKRACSWRAEHEQRARHTCVRHSPWKRRFFAKHRATRACHPAPTARHERAARVIAQVTRARKATCGCVARPIA